MTLGEIVRLLQTFHDQPQTLLLPEIPEGSFEKKLYSTYLSYLPVSYTHLDVYKRQTYEVSDYSIVCEKAYKINGIPVFRKPLFKWIPRIRSDYRYLYHFILYPWFGAEY